MQTESQTETEDSAGEPRLAAVLPRLAALRLWQASQTPGTGFDRLKAIEEVTGRLRTAYPGYFRSE